MPKQCIKCRQICPDSQFIGKRKQVTATCRFCRKHKYKFKPKVIKEHLESKPDCLNYSNCMTNAAYLNISRDKMGCYECDRYQPLPDVRITEMPTGSELSGAWIGWAKSKMGCRL